VLSESVRHKQAGESRVHKIHSTISGPTRRQGFQFENVTGVDRFAASDHFIICIRTHVVHNHNHTSIFSISLNFASDSSRKK
jgi:hypothetical protein